MENRGWGGGFVPATERLGEERVRDAAAAAPARHGPGHHPWPCQSQSTRLDEAISGHPLRSASLYRARLDAVRGQVGVDVRLIDP